jgi:hypothetical protein
MENLIFIRPPFYALLMSPVARLSFPSAFLLWRVLTLLAIVGFICMWPGDALVATAACAWSLPLAATFTVGQDVAFLLVAIMAGYRLLHRNCQFLAGVAFGLCAIKFHLFLLLPLLLIRRKMWRTMLGLATVAVVFFLASFLAAGPRWIQTYRAALQDKRMNPYPWNMVNLNGLFNDDPLWVIPVSLAVVGACWYFIVVSPIKVSLPVIIAGGVLITPHNTICDGLLFLPALLLARHSQMPVSRALALFALTPFYLLSLTGRVKTLAFRRRLSARARRINFGDGGIPAGRAHCI